MDKTGIFIVSLCGAALVWWFIAQNKIELARERYLATNQVAAAQSPLTATNAATNAEAASVGVTAPTPVFDSTAPEQTIVLTNQQARYTFTSQGGGLKLVELLDYPETISARWRKQDASPTNGFASLNTHAAVPLLAILGDSHLVGDGNFTLTRITDGVRAEKTFPDGLVLEKDFHLSSNYLVDASVSWKNTSDSPLSLPAQHWVIGTATPMDADDNDTYLATMWSDGVNEFNAGLSAFNTNTTILGIFPHTPTPVYHGGTGNVIWASAQNQFFALLTMTKTNEPAQQFLAYPVDLPALAEGSVMPPRGIQGELIYPSTTLAPHAASTRQVVIFAGPKEFRTLSRIGEEFKNRADLAMNFGSGYISFWGIGTFFAKLLLSAMNWLHDVTGLGYGWTIVVITLLLRAIFWPFTAVGIRSQRKMQALAPEIQVFKEKYKDDPQKAMQKQWELYRKHKVSPMSGCLPMVIQMPVFFGFLAMIRCAIELRGAHFLWVADLTKPDTILLIPGLNFPFNLLPLLMVGAMVWQAHLQPPSPGMDPAQQKMMRYMPLIFLVFLYNYSSGMALYMTVSTLSSAAQTMLIKKTIPPVTPVLTPAPKSKK
jgi:YidC/Oxa1 family membrane protein insertase